MPNVRKLPGRFLLNHFSGIQPHALCNFMTDGRKAIKLKSYCCKRKCLARIRKFYFQPPLPFCGFSSTQPFTTYLRNKSTPRISRLWMLYVGTYQYIPAFIDSMDVILYIAPTILFNSRCGCCFINHHLQVISSVWFYVHVLKRIYFTVLLVD